MITVITQKNNRVKKIESIIKKLFFIKAPGY